MDRGKVKTSAIFIATAGKTSVYRTLEEVPAALRNKLVKSTAGANSATVLIADRRGAEELLCSPREPAPEPCRLRACFATMLLFLVSHWIELGLLGILGLMLWLLVTIWR